jgi:3-methyl-2-oxobutanoate hydroxymethyltransferase
LEVIERLVQMGIPVMGHLGFTPQSIHGLGGTRVQGRSADEAYQILQDALALEKAGVFSVVLEMVPATVAKRITQQLQIPTIGIGAGNDCDGQILVTDDLLGKYTDFKPRFVRQYANLANICEQAVTNYAQDVRNLSFPDSSESFAFAEDEEKRLQELLNESETNHSEVSC